MHNMTETIKYTIAGNEHLSSIRHLLSSSQLPVSDIEEGKIDFIVASNESDEVIGCIGLERFEADALLRSFAVEQTWRNKKIGHQLFNRLLTMSRQQGVNDLHLLTTTAEKFFTSVGFSSLSRSEAPVSIKATAEFTSLCPSTSTYMVMTGIQTKAANS